MNSIISTLKSGTQDDKFEAIKNSIHYTDSPDRFAKELLPLILSQIQDSNSSDKVKLSILETLPHVADCALNCSPEYQFPVLASCIEAIVALFELPQCIKHAIVAYANMYSLSLAILARQPGQPAYWAIMTKLNITIDSLFEAPNMGLKASAAYFLRRLISAHCNFQVPMNHPYFVQSELQQQAVAVLNRFVIVLANPQSTTSVFICVVLNHIHGIIKECHTFSNPLIDLVLKFNPNLSPGSETQRKNVRRTFKVVLLSCLDIPQIESSHAEIARILGEMGYSRDVTIKQSRGRRILDREELEYAFQANPEPEQQPATTEISPEEIIPLIPNIPLDFLIPIIIQTIADADEIEPEVDMKEDAIEIDVDQILNQTVELTPDEKQGIVQDCLSRVLQMDSYFQKVDKAIVVNNDTHVAGRFGWLLVSARLMTRSNSNEKVKEYFLDFIGGSLSSRIELGLYWLFEEYINGTEYNLWLKRFLDILETENQEERLFTKFLVEVPEMTDFAISKVLDYCKDPEKQQLGITTLRDLIQNRPSSRKVCLQHLLALSADLDDETRKIAVESLKSFIPSNEELTGQIVEYAQNNLKLLSNEMENVATHLDLFLGCCSAKPVLLKELFESYPSMHSSSSEVVLTSCTTLFDSLHAEFDALCELIENYPPGSESLLLALIKSLMNNETIKDKTIELVKKVYLKQNLDVRFLLLIITYFDKATVLNQLDKLVEALDDTDEQKIVIKDVFVSLVEIQDEQQLVSPNELLIKLHLLDNVTVKKQCRAIDICFLQTAVFTKEIVAIVLTQLVDQVKLSPLLMRTIILALKTYPDLSRFIVEQQTKLINKKIWQIKPLWEGFAKSCVSLFPSSIGLLLSLPKKQALEVFEMESELRTLVADYIDKLPEQQQRRREIEVVAATVKESKATRGNFSKLMKAMFKNLFRPKHDSKITEFEKKYFVGKDLGKGAYATVKIVTRKADSEKFAVKIIDKKKMKGEEEAVKQEIDILSKIRNPHIVSLVELCTDKDHYYLVMDLATGGELFDRILSKGSYGEKDAAKLVSQILIALDYLHNIDIVHRDLKPENLLFRTEAEDSDLLLADFGLSRVVHQNEFLKTSCGTPHYVAPEILKESGHGKPVDMWSLGVITYVLLCGYTPFWGGETNSVPVLYNAIVNGKYEFDEENWSMISKEAKDFISKLLLVNPAKRMAVKEAMGHPWLATENNTNLLDNVKKNFSARSTLRKAVNAVRLINRMRSMSNSTKDLNK